MKLLKNAIAIAIFIAIGNKTFAGTVLESDWKYVVRGQCSDQSSSWWSSDEAIRIAENVLLFQREIGGWPKNTNMQMELSDTQKDSLLEVKEENTGCTIDNGAVDYELTYLSKVYKAISDTGDNAEIKAGFLLGIEYLLEAQYDNGGWPQFYPLKGGYPDCITYNDDAMVNVMDILNHVFESDGTYSITAPDSTIEKAENAYNKGVDCILNTQYCQKGVLTVWCAQHDEETLLPVKARDYELASLSGQESAEIIKLLMSLDNPDKEIKRAVYGGAVWYDENRIEGQSLESFTNDDGLEDLHIVYDESASDMWARFYTLDYNIPFFCSRDGVKKYSIAEISYERRNGYSWYNTSGFDVVSDFNSWVQNEGATLIIGPVNEADFYTTDTVFFKAFANENNSSSLSQFDLLLNNELISSTTNSTIDSYLTALDAGNYTFIAKATYKDGSTESDTTNFSVSLELFELKVVLGEGAGEYSEGQEVTISASSTSGTKVFNMWIGDTMYVDDVYDTLTTLTMPAEDISVRAVYVTPEETSISTEKRTEIVSIFPNPADDAIYFKLSDSFANEINVYSLDGTLVKNEKPGSDNFQIDVSDLNAGVYFIVIQTETLQYITNKIILN